MYESISWDKVNSCRTFKKQITVFFFSRRWKSYVGLENSENCIFTWPKYIKPSKFYRIIILDFIALSIYCCFTPEDLFLKRYVTETQPEVIANTNNKNNKY